MEVRNMRPHHGTAYITVCHIPIIMLFCLTEIYLRNGFFTTSGVYRDCKVRMDHS
jgi:hypothetical protein